MSLRPLHEPQRAVLEEPNREDVDRKPCVVAHDKSAGNHPHLSQSMVCAQQLILRENLTVSGNQDLQHRNMKQGCSEAHADKR